MLFLGVTDWLDGFFARKFKQESLFGKVFDPIADKTLMIGMFATLGYLKALPQELICSFGTGSGVSTFFYIFIALML